MGRDDGWDAMTGERYDGEDRMTSNDTTRPGGRLAGKVALVTGAARGIGFATARRFAAEGARVLLIDALDQVGDAAASIGPAAMALQVDVTDDDQVRGAVTRAIEWGGRLDILVCNAGRPWGATSLTASDDDWTRCLDLNLKAAWLCARAAHPHLRDAASRDKVTSREEDARRDDVGRGYAGRDDGGRDDASDHASNDARDGANDRSDGASNDRTSAIVTIASTQGYRSNRTSFPYSAAKGGLLALTRNLAVEYAADRIRVNAVIPGQIESVRTDAYFDSFTDPAEARRRVMSTFPLRRLGTPDDIAKAALYLASDDASWVTGTWLVVDGGRDAALVDLSDLTPGRGPGPGPEPEPRS
jgi:NAD(P)-dependent dehydrogenase (short-subunit alcohol dehydrogenase family)